MLKSKIIKTVNQIPKGKVASFSWVANQVKSHPRAVGFVLSSLNESEWHLLPWHRVVAKNGFVSSLKMGEKGMLQIQLLLEEGCIFKTDNQVDMKKCGLKE